MKHLLTILLCFLFVSLQAQVTIDNQYYNRSRSSNVWDRVKADSVLAAPSVKAAKGKSKGSIYFNSSLKTLEVYDSITATWYPLSRYMTQNGVVSGCNVNWVSGLNFQVSSGVYAINGTLYSFESDELTLDAADPSLPRIDVIALDTLGQIAVIKGTPASDPAKPQTGVGQVELTNVLINAGATEPAGFSKYVIYNENTESTVSSSLTVNANNTSFPFLGSKSIDLSSHAAGSVTFTLASSVDITQYTSLVIYVRLKAAYPNGTRIGIEMLRQNGASYETVSDNVLVSNGNYGYDRTVTGAYQAIQIPISAFTFLTTPSDAKQFSLFFTGSGGGMYIDYVHLQDGAITPGVSVSTFNNRSGNVIPEAGDYASFYLDTVYRRVDSVFGKKNSVERFLFKDSIGAGGGSTDTTSLSNRINLVQSNLDTTRTGIRADLNGKQGALTLTTTGSSGAATLVGNTLNIPQYSGGGGGSADSSWVSSETGVAPNQQGYLVNSTLGSLPSGWADNTPNATVTFSSKMIVSGGTTGTSSLSANTGASTVYSNRIDMDFYPYSKMRYAFTVVPQDKTGTTNGIALHFQANSLNFNSALRILFNLSGGADSGKISMATDFGSVFASSSSLAFNASDTLNIEVIRDGWYAIASMRNRRTGKFVDLKYNAFGSAFGTGGKAYLGLLGGSQHITSAKVESYEPKDGTAITIIGDSQFAGSGATSEEKIAAYQIFRGNKGKVANLSNGSLTLSAAVLSHVPAAIALNNPIIISLGYNDRRDLATDTATLKTRMAAVVDPIIAAGKTILGVTTFVPTNSTSIPINNNFDLAIVNYCAANNLRVIRIDSILKKSGDASYRIKENYLGADAIHWSDSGQYVAAQKVIDIIGETIPSLFKDSVSAVTMYNLPTGESNMNRLVVDNNGKVKQVPATTFDVIYNSNSYSGAGTLAQRNSSIHVDKTITTDSSVQVNNAIGLLLGFNGGSQYASGTSGSNVNISNMGTGGIGYPQVFDNITGLRNWVVNNRSLKSSGRITVSGNDNFVMPFGNGSFAISGNENIVLGTGGNVFNLTSGSSNTWIGKDAGRGVATGSNNLIIATKNTSATSLTSTLNNAIIIGELTSFTASANDYQANDIAFSTSYFNDEQFWFGGRTKPEKIIYLNFPSISNVSNYQGNDGIIRAGKGSGTGRSGYITFQSWNSTTSGSTLHSTASTEMTIENKKVVIDNRFQTSTGADVASANDLTLGSDGNVFTITGTTQINAITTTNWQAGSEIILIFSGSVTVKNNTAGGGGTAVMLLAGGVDFSATSNDVLKLVYNGTSWFEVSRSVN